LGDPFYPGPAPENHQLYEKYRVDAEKIDHVIFIGRLAEYRYLNMDQVVEKALATFDRIADI
jgi:UDP-galactopyranose mutase